MALENKTRNANSYVLPEMTEIQQLPFTVESEVKQYSYPEPINELTPQGIKSAKLRVPESEGTWPHPNSHQSDLVSTTPSP